MFRRIAAALLFAAALTGIGLSSAIADEAADVRAVIVSQLSAFKAGDAATAYSHAGPAIRKLYASPESFMQMVERGYGAVYRSSLVTFGEMEQRGDLFRQEVRLSDPRGLGYVANYVLQRQDDGSLKIVAVSMRRSGDIAT